MLDRHSAAPGALSTLKQTGAKVKLRVPQAVTRLSALNDSYVPPLNVTSGHPADCGQGPCLSPCPAPASRAGGTEESGDTTWNQREFGPSPPSLGLLIQCPAPRLLPSLHGSCPVCAQNLTAVGAEHCLPGLSRSAGVGSCGRPGAEPGLISR
ncbi:hypothetical protein KIL84_023217 [Mauremys mutica]|uniref:Uncharacterized protein n=1 Tax=Mauremys mutica TaxID=74926 RepID=A0A9D4APE6_9SAUR|nr:hypothetical protein KIL84_023217 [Mauremys mutica]